MSLGGVVNAGNPSSVLKSRYLALPAVDQFQVLKYIADFTLTVPAPDVNGSAAAGYIFNPTQQQNFGVARTLKIDTRWMLCPVTLSLSDSLLDIITVAPGQVKQFAVPGGASDTYTVTLSPIIPATVANQTFNFGYAKLFFYNYIPVESYPSNRQSPQLILNTTLNGANASFDFDFLDYSGYSGLPYLKWIAIKGQQSAANINQFLRMVVNPAVGIHYDSNITYWWSLATVVAGSNVVDIFEPMDIQIPPTNPQPLPANEGKVNDYLYDINVNTTGGVTGAVNVSIGVAWP